MFASSDAETSVEPTGVDPTGVDPTGVDPTGVDPTGAEPSWPATSIWSTVVAPVALLQFPSSSGICPFVPHQASKPPGRLESGVLPIRSVAQWTDLSSVVVRSTCCIVRSSKCCSDVLPSVHVSVFVLRSWSVIAVSGLVASEPQRIWPQVTPWS